MDFDDLTLVRMVTPSDPVELSPEESFRLQDAHLAYLHELWSQGLLIAAGPASGDDNLRGLSIIRGDVEVARALISQDPSVLGGKFEVEYLSWSVPAAMVVSGEGAPPKSVAEAWS
jgi:uncharacterized protein YciI